MGMLVDGQWQEQSVATTDETGHFIRAESAFRDWVTQDSHGKFPAEANRYHLYVSYACPWASRTLMMRQLKGLEEVISFSVVDAHMGDKGWTFFTEGDPIHHADYLYKLYLKADPMCTSKVTVPVLWDKKTNSIVNNESSEIIRMLNSEFNAFARNKADYYPETLRGKIDEINEFIYERINNGVYRCGFAESQEAYDEAFKALFDALDQIEKILSQKRYLVGDTVTEADWRLFPTLIRFDVVYVGHFKCNLRRIEEYPCVSNYVRELYQWPGIRETVNFEHIKQHYYTSHPAINPSGIVPKGPEIDYETPHDRG